MGIPGNSFFERKYFRKIWRKKKKNCRHCSKNSVIFVKTSFDVSYGNFVWKIKNVVEKFFIFQLFADFQLKVNGTSAKIFQHGCLNCVLFVRRNKFTLIFFSFGCFFILKVFRLWAKVSLTFLRKMLASCQIYNLCVLRKILKILKCRIFFEGIFSYFSENVSSFETKFFRNNILSTRRNNLNFYWNLQFFEVFRVWLERSHTYGAKSNQVLKITI